jgi:hypothetical protein
MTTEQAAQMLVDLENLRTVGSYIAGTFTAYLMCFAFARSGL